MHIGFLFRRARAWHGASVALVDRVGPWTFEALMARIARFGQALAGLGLLRGERVALLLPDIREHLEADYGAMAAGFISVPLSAGMRRQDLVAHLRRTGARAVVAEATLIPMLAELRSELPDLQHIIALGGTVAGAHDYEDLLARASDRFLPPGESEDIAQLALSAGRTGQPKIVKLSHGNISAVAGNLIAGLRIGSDSVFLNVRPLWAPLQFMVLAYLLGGSRIVLGGAFDAERFPFQMARFSVTRSAMSPVQLAELLPHLAPEDVALNAMEMLHIGGAALPEAVCDEALNLVGPRISVHYGLAEAPFTCLLSAERLSVKRALRNELRTTVGRPFFGYETRLEGVEDTFAMEQEGEILIRGPHVMAGYWDDPEATARVLCDGWLRTGDIGMLSSGYDLKVIGRTQDLIFSAGQTVSLREVEAAIARHPAIREVAVVGLPDGEAGEALTAFVVLKDESAASAEEILAFTHGALIGAKRPKAIHLRRELPRSDYGGIFLPGLLTDIVPLRG